MAGELAGFDVLPAAVADRIVAWCFLNYPHSGRDAAICALRDKHGVPPERGAPAVDAAIARAQGWTAEHAQDLAWEAEGWERPVPLSAVPALPSFPVGIYPPWLAAEVTALAGFTQTPPDLAGTIVLSVLATALGGRARVEVREGWSEPANLYTVVAMPPGSRKSPVHSALVAPVVAVEAAMASEASASIAEAKALRSVAEKAARAAENKAVGAQGTQRDKLQAGRYARPGRHWTRGHVNTVIVQVQTGRDGKLYPARPLTRQERNRARWLAHNLVHRDGLSVRQAQRAMAERYGVRRAVGTIARDLANFECPRCPHLNA